MKFPSPDEFLLFQVFQPISDKLTDLTGRTCYWFARQAFALCFASAIGHLIFRIVDFQYSDTAFFAFSPILFGIVFLMYHTVAKFEVEGEIHFGDWVWLSKTRSSWLWYNLLFTWMPIMLIFTDSKYWLTHVILNLSLLVGLYFATCIPRTPRKRWKTKLATESA